MTRSRKNPPTLEEIRQALTPERIAAVRQKHLERRAKALGISMEECVAQYRVFLKRLVESLGTDETRAADLEGAFLAQEEWFEAQPAGFRERFEREVEALQEEAAAMGCTLDQLYTAMQRIEAEDAPAKPAKPH
jgi:hypothetical protein